MSDNTKQSNKNLIVGILVYGIGTFGTKILSILIVPLYTYFISTEQMGIYDILITTMGLLTPVLTLQISDAAYRWMIRNEKVTESIKATYRVLLIGSIIFLGMISVISLFVKIPYVWHFSFTLIVARCLESTQKLLRGLKNQKLYALSSIIYAFFFLSLNVVLIVFLHLGVEALFLSQIASGIITIAIIFLAEKRIRFNVIYKNDFTFYKELLLFSIPLIPNIMNWWIMNASDRYLIGIFLGTSFNGIYAISYKFPTILQQVFALFNYSWQDLAVSQDENDGDYYSNLFNKLESLTLAIIPLAIVVSQSYILITMNSLYHESARYVGFLFLGTVFQCYSSFFGVGYLITKNTKQASLTSIYGAIVNFVINIVLIKQIGLSAAAISTFCGFFVMFLFRYWQTNKSLHITVKWSKLFIMLTVDIVFAILFIDMQKKLILPLLFSSFFYFAVFNYSFIKHLCGIVIEKVKR